MFAKRNLSKRKQHGVHYTPQRLAAQVASAISRYLPTELTKVSVLDPAIGDGELVREFVSACASKKVTADIRGFDLDEGALKVALLRLQGLSYLGEVELLKRDFLDAVLPSRLNQSMLFGDLDCEPAKADVVIANPPYVRTQTLGKERTENLAAKFALDGRIDLYQAFLKGIAWSLNTGGIAGVILPNRFMTIQGGANLRAFIRAEFEVLEVWDLGDTRLFEAAVLPAVLILRKRSSFAIQREPASFISAYESTKPSNIEAPIVASIFDAFYESGIARLHDGRAIQITRGCLDMGMNPESVWRLSTTHTDTWLQTVKQHTALTFNEVGKVRVGVKSTADKVFLRKNWEDLGSEKPELLFPVTTHQAARRFRSHAVLRTILYPYDMSSRDRRPADLHKHPETHRYLNANRKELEGRKYLQASGREWFELWVPQEPSTWKKPKVVFRDISEHPTFWMDLEGTIVNGDCYWISPARDRPDLLWLLLGVANSTFIEDFYDHSFNNKLYSGRRRFMTQYVEAFPLPDPTLESSIQIAELAKELYSEMGNSDTKEKEEFLNKLVHRAFGVS